jgi:hypothetical protein
MGGGCEVGIDRHPENPTLGRTEPGQHHGPQITVE